MTINIETWKEMTIAWQKEATILRAERDKAWLKIGSIRNEIDCRIQHGADSNGHLEAILKMIDKDE